MRRAQDRARSARSRKNGSRIATTESRALGALKLASEASCTRSAQWECVRQAGRFFSVELTENLVRWCKKIQFYEERPIYCFLKVERFNFIDSLIYLIMFSGEANSTSFSLLSGKMPVIPFGNSLKSALVVVEYNNNQNVIDTSIGVFTSVNKIITYKKCSGEISVRREDNPSPILVHGAMFNGDVTTVFVSCLSSKSFYILKL